MDLFRMAFVIVYPDGYVDYIPIKEEVSNRVEYFYEYLKSSPRFQRIVRDNHFDFDWLNNRDCSSICKMLVQNNVIVFMNDAISYVLMDMENAEKTSYFVISLPSNYEELLGIPFVREQINKLNNNQFELEQYLIGRDDFEEFDTDEYDNFFEKNKQKKEIDIFKMAFIIVYPDGYVDPIPIKEGVSSRVEYFYEYFKSSPRFKRIVRDNHFDFDWMQRDCSSICKMLVQNNVIVFMNDAISYVLIDMENAEKTSYFVISLPNNYEELPGISFVREQINKLNNNQFELNQYRIGRNGFEEFDSDECNKIFGENKINKEKEKNL